MTEVSKPNIHLALVHFPVYNKIGEVVVSSVTTLDVHDISRVCRTYGVGTFYVITPLKTQQELVGRLIGHWLTGYGAEYNPTRKEALLKTVVKNNLNDVIKEITEESEKKLRVIVTGAKKAPQSIGYEALKKELKKFRDGLAKGDHIVTIGGIHGKILEIADSTELVQSEGTKIRLDKSAISQSSEDQLMTK